MSQIFNWESKAIRPLAPVNTASAFSKWVFEQSVEYKVQNFFIQSKNMKLGIDAHQSIDDFFRREWSNKLDVGSDSPSDWIVEHTEQDGRAGKFYKASSLKVNNKPLHCSPDVLLRHKSKSQVVIIERKTTRNNYHTIPAKGWPNVQAQLWCYSWIDSILDVDEVFLVNQVWWRWGRIVQGLKLRNYHPMWKRGDKAISDKCLKWFKLYGGELDPQAPYNLIKK